MRKNTSSPPEKREIESLRLIAGQLCLDFANTCSGHTRPDPHEYLRDYRDLVLWGRHAGALEAAGAEDLLQEGAQNPAGAEAALHKALRLREIIFRIFSGLAHGAPPAREDLAGLNVFRLEALNRSRIVQAAGGFRLEWSGGNWLENMLWPVALSAAELLVSEQARRVRQCRGQGCDWLFVDASRSHRRRWCSMEECGNRSKMRRRSERAKLKEIA